MSILPASRLKCSFPAKCGYLTFTVLQPQKSNTHLLSSTCCSESAVYEGECHHPHTLTHLQRHPTAPAISELAGWEEDRKTVVNKTLSPLARLWRTGQTVSNTVTQSEHKAQVSLPLTLWNWGVWNGSSKICSGKAHVSQCFLFQPQEPLSIYMCVQTRKIGLP